MTSNTCSYPTANTCLHLGRLPNPAGGAWYCPECDAYPLIGAFGADDVIELAKRHVGNGAIMASSAKLCLVDAEKNYAAGDIAGAHRRALKSLAYSIGILHPDYQKVK